MTDDDERYFTVNGKRWRKSDPAIPEALRAELVKELMRARAAIKTAKKDGDASALRSARERVQDAKVALGERGRAWWLPKDEDALSDRIACAMRTLLRQRDAGKTICPSDAARVAAGGDWRDVMNTARDVAWTLAEKGWLEVTQRGEVVSRPARGPIRLRRRC